MSSTGTSAMGGAGAAATPDAETAAFFTAAAEGRFLLKFCNSCERAHWYPRAICPFCCSTSTEFRPASGRGTIYSWTVLRRAKPVFAIAYVTLEEGPTLLTNIVGADPDGIAIGQRVEVVLPGDAARGTPVFRIAAAG